MQTVPTTASPLTSCATPDFLLRIGVIAVLFLLTLRALVVPLFVWDMAYYPFDYFYGEGDLLFYVHRLLRGENLYNNSSALPFLGNIYPPLYYWIAGAFGKIAGLSLGSLRVFGLVPLLGVCVLLGFFLRRKGVSWPLTAIAVLLIPCSYSLGGFFIYPRPDAWMALFGFASVIVLLSAPERPSLLVLAGLLAACAVFSKQTALIGIAAVNLHLLINQPRRGLILGAAALVSALLLLGISLGLYGSAFWESMTGLTAKRSADAARFGTIYVPALAPFALPFAAALYRMAAHAATRRWDLLDSYLLGNGLMTLMILFDASGTNYFLPLVPAVLLAAALQAQELLEHSATSPGHALGLLALVLLHLALQMPGEEALTPPTREELAEAENAARFLSENAGPVYTDRMWGPIAERPYVSQVFVEPTHLKTLPPGRLNLAPLKQMFADKQFVCALFSNQSYQLEELMQFAQQHYRTIRMGRVKMCFGVTMRPLLYYVVPKTRSAEPPKN